ncbi:hypothetical protein [Leucobacter muris]|nr:hypothetical protein [Leucobacter muris]
MGDHQKLLAPGASFWDALKDREDRTIFNRVWSPDGVRFARDQIDQFSMYPTLIELAGIDLDGHRAGIGVSALADADDVPRGSMLDLQASEYSAVVQSRAAGFYRELWDSAQ